jgi:prefoldin subunit 2
LPQVQQNVDGIVQIMKQLAETYKKKEDDMMAFQKKYNIRVK